MEPPARFICPITLEIMQEPYMCHTCSHNFESAAILAVIESQGHCPMCRANLMSEDGADSPLGVSLNRAFREEIQEWLSHATEQGPREEVNDGLMDARTPFTGVFVGKYGTGKSKSINSAAGRTVCVSASSATGVTQAPSVVFNEVLLNRHVKFVDAPGLFDPSKSNQETLAQLTQLLQQEIDGMDAVFHVIRMGRLDESEMETPRIILDGLASDPAERARLAKRYKIIVTHCDTSDDDNENESVATLIEQFRGVMLQVFPQELRAAVQNAIFVEHNQRYRSDYNDLVAFRKAIVNELVRCRELRATCFKPKMLSEVIDETRKTLSALLAQWFGDNQLNALSNSDILALQNFFQFVESSGKWQQPRSSDRLPQVFVEAWNGLNVVVRDALAVELAGKAVTALKEAAARIAEREFQRRLAEERKKDIPVVSTGPGKGIRCSIM